MKFVILQTGLALLESLTSLHGQGSIHYVPVPGYQIPGPELGAVPDDLGVNVYTSLDLNNDGAIDLVFRTSQNQQIVLPGGGNYVVARRNPPPDLSRYLTPLTEGTEIGPSLQPALSWETTLPPTRPFLDPLGVAIIGCFANDEGSFCLGDFVLEDAYLGIQFEIDGQTHYGWMHLKNRGRVTDLHGYAYNTIPDQPILAGQVPEPSTWALLLGGSVMIFLRRRRRLQSG